MDLNLFENKKGENSFINKFIEELKVVLNNTRYETQNRNESNNELDEYHVYEKRKIFLDNKSRKGNQLVWVMDTNSVCVSENGDGGPIAISSIDLPNDINVGDVYEKVGDIYVFNEELTKVLADIGG